MIGSIQSYDGWMRRSVISSQKKRIIFFNYFLQTHSKELYRLLWTWQLRSAVVPFVCKRSDLLEVASEVALRFAGWLKWRAGVCILQIHAAFAALLCASQWLILR